MKHLIVILNIFFFLDFSFAQNRITDSQSHGWYMYFGSYFMSPKIGIHSEYQWRRNEIIENWQQSLARIGIILKNNELLAFTLGYGHIITYPYGKQPVPKTFLEHRIWQQVLLNTKFNKTEIKHRYRLEQRWLEQNNASWKYINRFRYQFWIDIPLTTIAQKKKLITSLYDEIFINFGKNVQKNIFDQNRLYIALGFGLSHNYALRLGYMNQIITKGDGTHQEMNHTLQISLHHNFTFKKQY
jgi:hypothetical protein